MPQASEEIQEQTGSAEKAQSNHCDLKERQEHQLDEKKDKVERVNSTLKKDVPKRRGSKQNLPGKKHERVENGKSHKKLLVNLSFTSCLVAPNLENRNSKRRDRP